MQQKISIYKYTTTKTYLLTNKTQAKKPRYFGLSSHQPHLKPGIDCARLPRAAVRARQTRSFVRVTVFTQHRARQPRAAVDRRCSNTTRPSQLNEHSTLKSLCRGLKNRSDLARHAPSSRAAVFVLPRAATWFRLCEAKQRTLPRAAAARNRYPA